MKKILITGYTGFIGSNLTNKLKDNFLSGVDISKNDSVRRHFVWEKLEECVDQEVIIHLAGKAHDMKNTLSEEEYFKINVGLTQKIFQFFLDSTASKFIFFSSVKAISDSVAGPFLTEEVFPDPKSTYGRSKLEAEKYISNEFQKWKEKEKKIGKDNEWKKVFILRPCMVHGPGNKGNLNLLFKLQQKGLPWPLGSFENKRSFCSINNILFVIQQLIDRNIESGIYLVADDEPISTNEIIRLMANILNKNVIIWRIPQNVIKSIAKAGDLLCLPLNSERLKKLTESYIVSNQKLKNAFGIENMPITSSEGMKQTIESFIEHRHDI
jgi:nucleoside-diphosphate-sugar epimerase